MRTVTFSNKSVATLINENFVSTWSNRNPHFHNCDLGEESRIVRHSYEMFSTKNFCTFFLTPDKKVLHYFSGYMNPEFFKEEVRFVLDLSRKVMDDEGRLRKGWSKVYREMHLAHAKKHSKDVRTVQKVRPPRAGTPEYAAYRKNQAGFHERKGYLTEGLRYLHNVHRVHESNARKNRLVPLSKVVRNYLGGNPFTEE